MKTKNKPLGIILFVTLPQILLAGVLILLLSQKHGTDMMWLLVSSAIANAVFTAYALIFYKKDSIKTVIYIAIAIVYAALLAACVLSLNDSALFHGLISARLIAILLCAVSMLFSLFGIAENTQGNLVSHAISLAAVPLAFFLGYNVLSGAGLDTFVMILIIAAAYTAIYLLVKIMKLGKDQAPAFEERPKKNKTVLYIIFSLVLPLAGLILNLSLDNMMGDFSDPVFFIVPVVNGILLVLTPFADKRMRLLSFFIVSASTSYLIYFFIVFLPYVPIGFVGLAIILGALIFAPTAALVMQVIYLIKEWPKVRQLWGFKRVAAVFIAGLLVLPTLVLTSFIGDRRNLETAVAYLEQNGSAQGETVDLHRLDRAINNAGVIYEPVQDILSVSLQNNTPLISSLYAGLVLDHRMMSQDNIAQMRRLFFNEYVNEDIMDGMPVNNFGTSAVSLIKTDTQTEYDETIGAYRTWVNLTLQAPQDVWNDEYVTEFELPEGVYVSDYYLDVNGVRKEGILADKRAAMWVYEDIVTSQQDPGMLRYTADRTLELRVFPFSDNELRYTGFEVMHAAEAQIKIDGHIIELPAAASKAAEMDGAVLIPAAVKKTLPKAQQRSLQYYFVVDCSMNSDIAYQKSLIKEYAQSYDISEATVVFASYNLKTCDLSDIDEIQITPHSGFNLALAVKTILSENNNGTVPVILFTSDNPTAALFPEHVSWLAAQYPESSGYYQLNDDGTLTPYSFISAKRGDKVKEPVIVPALSYNGIRVRDDGQSELVLTDKDIDFAAIDSSHNQYKQAVMLDAAARSGAAQNAADSLKLLRESFRAGVLTPQTAFIVVETDAQEYDLFQKQKELLKADTDLAQQAAQKTLDEPPLLICILVGALGVACLLGMRHLGKVKKL